MNNMLLRSLSGTLYVALIVCSLIFSDIYFCVLCLIFGVLAMVEFDTLTSRRQLSDGKFVHGEPSTTLLALDVFGIIVILLPAIGCNMTSLVTNMFVYYIAGLILWGCFLVIRFYTALYQKEEGAVRQLAYSMLAQIYLGIGLLAAQFMSLQSAGFVLLVFILIWLNDTGAYLCGRAFGRLKLFPRLSPKKTWEGFLGGLLLGVVVSMVFLVTGITGKLMYIPLLDKWETAVGLPLVVGITGTLGDLFESMIKRSVDAKDSGNIIPGHGGILDRIDSMLFAMPATVLYILFCEIL